MYFREVEEIDDKIGNAFKVITFFALIPSFITFYSFYFIVFPKFLVKKKFVMSVILGLSFSLIAGIIGYIGLERVTTDFCMEEEEGELIGLVIFMAFVALISGIVSLVIRGFLTWFDEIKLKEALQQKNHEMELALVKSQLDPHFLFNTINNIDVLILKNATHASDYLNKLSDIMRFMLFETKTEKISLAKEIAYIEKYIELQKIRTANSNYINYTVTGNSNGHTIAPMVFIPFIENAFKHTTNKKLKDAIDIRIEIEPDRIVLRCANKIDPNRKLLQESHGLGNDLIEKRLNLIYPSQHQLEIVHENNLYEVHLTINTAAQVDTSEINEPTVSIDIIGQRLETN